MQNIDPVFVNTNTYFLHLYKILHSLITWKCFAICNKIHYMCIFKPIQSLPIAATSQILHTESLYCG